MGTRFDVGLHVLDLLIQFVVLVEQAGEVVIAGLQAGDQITVFGKHTNSGKQRIRDNSLRTMNLSMGLILRFYDHSSQLLRRSVLN